MNTPIYICLFRASLLFPNLIAGCSECLSSKAAGEQEPDAYPLRYVEDSCELRTKLAGIMDSRLVGDHPRPLQPTDTVLPEYGRVLVKDAERICRQDSPRTD